MDSGGVSEGGPMRPDVEKCVSEATQSLMQGLLKRLEDYRAIQKKHPTLNAIERLSVDICRLIATGDLELSKVDELVQALSGDGFVRRADRMVNYLNGVENREGHKASWRLYGRSPACRFGGGLWRAYRP